jgi:hypothetical protein
VLCFEAVHADQVCYRWWFADWFEDPCSILVAELAARPADRGEVGRVERS